MARSKIRETITLCWVSDSESACLCDYVFFPFVSVGYSLVATMARLLSTSAFLMDEECLSTFESHQLTQELSSEAEVQTTQDFSQ